MKKFLKIYTHVRKAIFIATLSILFASLFTEINPVLMNMATILLLVYIGKLWLSLEMFFNMALMYGLLETGKILNQFLEDLKNYFD